MKASAAVNVAATTRRNVIYCAGNSGGVGGRARGCCNVTTPVITSSSGGVVRKVGHGRVGLIERGGGRNGGCEAGRWGRRYISTARPSPKPQFYQHDHTLPISSSSSTPPPPPPPPLSSPSVYTTPLNSHFLPSETPKQWLKIPKEAYADIDGAVLEGKGARESWKKKRKSAPTLLPANLGEEREMAMMVPESTTTTTSVVKKNVSMPSALYFPDALEIDASEKLSTTEPEVPSSLLEPAIYRLESKFQTTLSPRAVLKHLTQSTLSEEDLNREDTTDRTTIDSNSSTSNYGDTRSYTSHGSSQPYSEQRIVPPPPEATTTPDKDPKKAYLARIQHALENSYYPLFFTSLRRYLLAGYPATPTLYTLCLRACSSSSFSQGQLGLLSRSLIEEMISSGFIPTEEDLQNALKAGSGCGDWMLREWAQARLRDRWIEPEGNTLIRAYVKAGELERAINLAEKLVLSGGKVTYEAGGSIILSLCALEETAEAWRLISTYNIGPPSTDGISWHKILESAARTQHPQLVSHAFHLTPNELRTEYILTHTLYTTTRRAYLRIADKSLSKLSYFSSLRVVHREAYILTYFEHLLHYPTPENLKKPLELLRGMKFLGSTLILQISSRLSKLDSEKLSLLFNSAAGNDLPVRIKTSTYIRQGNFSSARSLIKESIQTTSVRKKELLREVVFSLISYANSKGTISDEFMEFTEWMLGMVVGEVGKDRELCLGILELAAGLRQREAVRVLLALMEERGWGVPGRLRKVVEGYCEEEEEGEEGQGDEAD